MDPREVINHSPPPRPSLLPDGYVAVTSVSLRLNTQLVHSPLYPDTHPRLWRTTVAFSRTEPGQF